MTEHDDDGVWRDEQRLPLAELAQALAVNAQDGQVDDTTGNDSGEETAFGHGPTAEGQAAAGSDDDPTSARQRRLKPSFEGRTGPH